MENDVVVAEDKAKISKVGAIRFSIYSILGILIFFVNISGPGGKSTTPYDWACIWITGHLAPYYTWVTLLAALVMVFVFVKKKVWMHRGVQLALSLLTMIGVLLVILNALNAIPAFVVNSGLYDTVTAQFGRAFVQMFLCVLLLPLITSYGLPEAVGVFLRPVTRTLFKLPGKTAVIITSAFVGSYFVGITQAGDMYENGKLTNREATMLATGFSTASLGYIIMLCGLAGITHLFMWVVLIGFIALFLVNIVICRIYPMVSYGDEYYEGAEPEPEEEIVKGENPFKEAFRIGSECAERGGNILPRFGKMAASGLPMVSQFVTCAIGCLIVFGFINLYTPIFTWIGYLFVPILKLLGVPDAGFIATNCAMSMISNMTGAVTLAAAESMSIHARFFGCVIMAPVVIFMTDFFVCLNSTKIKVNVGHMFLLWLERMILSVLFIGIASRIMFG